MPFKMLRTPELDKKFAKYWYCNTCQHYICNVVGFVKDHSNHKIVKMVETLDENLHSRTADQRGSNSKH